MQNRVVRGTATTAAAVALIAIGVPAMALASHPASHAGPSQIGPGYPPPGGIYSSFTNCLLFNPLMHESNDFTACTAGLATSGSITIGNITTLVVRPVNVQFGFWTGVNQTYYADVVPPAAGLSAILSTKPDLIPESLTTALSCSTATDPVVKNLCTKAENFGGKYQDVYALAVEAGPITNFNLLNWTQPVMFKLINPLLGSNCSIGTIGNPVVLNPGLTVAPGGQLTLTNDPDPAKHPDTFVLGISQATAADTTFAAPGVSGCGPGGVNNIPVEQALDAGTGLPAASGVNSLTLNGTFGVAATEAYGDSSVPQPADNAKILLSAFKASVGTPHSSGSMETGHRISAATMHRLLRHLGMHSR